MCWDKNKLPSWTSILQSPGGLWLSKVGHLYAATTYIYHCDILTALQSKLCSIKAKFYPVALCPSNVYMSDKINWIYSRYVDRKWSNCINSPWLRQILVQHGPHITVLCAAQHWLVKNTYLALNEQNTPHTPPSWGVYGVSVYCWQNWPCYHKIGLK